MPAIPMFFTGNESFFDNQPASGTAQCFWGMQRCSSSSSNTNQEGSNNNVIKPSIIQLKSGRIYTVLHGGTPAVAIYRGKTFLFMNQRVQSTVFGGYDLITAVHVKEERPFFWMQLSKGGKSESFDQTCYSGWHPTPAEAMRSLFNQVGREFARLDKGDAAKAYGITLLEYTTAVERDPLYSAKVAELKQAYKSTIENLAYTAPRAVRVSSAKPTPTTTMAFNEPSSAAPIAAAPHPTKQEEIARLLVQSSPVLDTREFAPRADTAFVKRQRITTMTNHDRHAAAEGSNTTTQTNSGFFHHEDVMAQIHARSMSIIAEAASYKLFEENARSLNIEPNLDAWRQSRRLADGAFKAMVTPRADILKQFITTLVAMDSRLLALPNFEDSVLTACVMVGSDQPPAPLKHDVFCCATVASVMKG